MRNRRSSIFQDQGIFLFSGENGLTKDASCFKGRAVASTTGHITSSKVSGVEQRVGSVLVARPFLVWVEETCWRKDWVASEFSVSGMGADDERRYVRAVIGASKRVTLSGTWCLSNSWMAASSSWPFFPSTRSWAIFVHLFISFGSTSRTFRFSEAAPFALVCTGLKAYLGNLRLCSSSASLAFECQSWRSSSGRFCHVRPIILDNVEWLVSTSVETCWLFIKEDRKRMKALGGLGIWFSGFFLVWAWRRGGKPSSGGGKRINSGEGASTSGGGESVKVIEVIFGVKATSSVFVGSRSCVDKKKSLPGGNWVSTCWLTEQLISKLSLTSWTFWALCILSPLCRHPEYVFGVEGGVAIEKGGN